jgi:hypothetical protein
MGTSSFSRAAAAAYCCVEKKVADRAQEILKETAV